MNKFNATRFNLYTVITDLKVNLWVILLAIITGFVGGTTYHNYIRPQRYVSNMIVSINLSGYTTDATALSLARTVVIAETLDDVFQSNALRDVVKKELGGKMTGEISATQLGETNLIGISVTDSAPEKAHDTLVAVYENYSKVTDIVFSNVIIRTMVNPTMPTKAKVTTSANTFGVLCAVILAVAVTAAIVIISFLRDTVKNVSDVERELDTKLFGTVHTVKGIDRKLPQRERRIIITNPRVGYDFVNSVRKMTVKLESLKRTKGYNVFMVTSVAENEGKTTVAVNLALSLTQSGNRVLLLDCDFKHPSVHYFFDTVERNVNSDFHTYLTEGGDFAHFIKRDESGLYIVDNEEHCKNSSELLSGARFAAALKALKEQFDYIIIDTPPCGIAVDAEVMSGLADAALLVVRQDAVAVPAINEQIDNLSKCYLAGCVFSAVGEFGNKIGDSDGTVQFEAYNG